MLATFLFTGKKMFAVTTQKSSHDNRLYTYPSTKKKDVVTKRLRTQFSFSQWQHKSSSNKLLALHQLNICRLRSEGYWGVL